MKEIYKLLHHWLIVINNLKAVKIVLKLNKILPKPHPYLVHRVNSSPVSYLPCWTSPKPNKDTLEFGNILPGICRSQRQKTWYADKYLTSTRSLIFTILIFSFFTRIRNCEHASLFTIITKALWRLGTWNLLRKYCTL